MRILLLLLFLGWCTYLPAQGLPVGKVYKKPIYTQRVTYVRSSYPSFDLKKSLRNKKSLIYHIIDSHSVQVPKEVNLQELSYSDLYRLHAIIHAIEDGRMNKPERLGYWQQKENVYTFVWEL
jgi:hypothetical protein